MPLYDIYFKKQPVFLADPELTRSQVLNGQGGFALVKQGLKAFGPDAAYLAMQSIEWAPTKKQLEDLGVVHASMSQGDVLHDRDEDKMYQLDSHDFQEVTDVMCQADG